MARFHLYPVPTDGRRILKSVTLVTDHDLPSGAHYYTFRAGVASADGVDYYGVNFIGATHKISANEPLLLIEDQTIKLLDGESVVLDVTSVGLPADLAGTTVHVETDHDIKDPANLIQDPVTRAAVDGLADHLRSIRAGTKTVSIALPRQIDDSLSRQALHTETDTSETIASGSYVASTKLATLTVGGTPGRPGVVKVTASATFHGTSGTDILYIAISNDGGTTVYCPNGQYGRVDGLGSVTVHFAEEISQNVTYTLMLRQAGGAPLVLNQAMSLLATEA